MCMLTNENLSLAEDGIWWIRSSRKKTGVDFEIPLMELPLHIIEKYRDVAPEGKLLPMYSNSSLNHYLKQIAVLCGIERKLVFHVARHTYATEITLPMVYHLKRSARCWDTAELVLHSFMQRLQTIR